MTDDSGTKPLISTQQEAEKLGKTARDAKSAPPEYPLAFTDSQFLFREELRPVRLQLELLRPEIILNDYGIEATIVFFGSARVPIDPEVAKHKLRELESKAADAPDDEALAKKVRIAKNQHMISKYTLEASKLARIVSTAHKTNKNCNFYVVTGGGPGFMEAANRGAYDVNSRSIALNIILPHEQIPNKFVTPELTFQFHYFAIRKMHFFIRARAMIYFPGGFGTLDELLDALTLMQTGKMDHIPILLFGEEYWRKIINFEELVEQGMINESDLDLFQYVETADQAWQCILDFYGY